MSKRFTDTDKWDRPWFRKLPVKYKALWEYIRDKCDPVGVWYVDFELATIMIGEDVFPSEALALFEKQIQPFKQGTRWLIKDFISFQCGELKDTNNYHRSLMSKLAVVMNDVECSLDKNSGAAQPQTRGWSGDKEKEEEGSSLKREGGVGEGKNKNRAPDLMFEHFWAQYPKKQAKKPARAAWDKLRPNDELFRKIIEALKGWKRTEQWQKSDGEFVPLPGTWLNQRRWEDEIPKGGFNAGRTSSSIHDRLLGEDLRGEHEKTNVGHVPSMFQRVDKAETV